MTRTQLRDRKEKAIRYIDTVKASVSHQVSIITIMKDLKDAINHLQKAIPKLEKVVENEHEFFTQFVLLLLSQNWVIQQRPGLDNRLYINYGYRNGKSYHRYC